MRKILGILIVSFLFVFVGCSTKQKVQEQVNQTTSQALNVDISKSVASITSNYNIVESATGVTLYKHKTKDIYVQVINTKVAKVEFVSNYTGKNEEFYLLDIPTRWDQVKKIYPKAFSICNLSLFAYDKFAIQLKTNLPFGFKINNKIQSNGYGVAGTENTRKILTINSIGSVGVANYSDNIFFNSLFPSMAVGLTVDYNLKSDKEIGRTFIGNDTNNNLVIVNGVGTQDSIKKVLIEFNCTNMMMFDGSDSSQLKTNKNSFNPAFFTTRYLPNYLIVVAK